MTSTEFINSYILYFSRSHAMSASAIAALHLAALEPLKQLYAKRVSDELGIGYQSAMNVIKRLRLDGYLDASGMLTDQGRDAMHIGRRLPPLPGA